MNTFNHPQDLKINRYRSTAGVILILVGAVIFLDRFLKIGWLSLIILPALGLYLFSFGVRLRHVGLIIAGSLLGGVGSGIAQAFFPAGRALNVQLGMILMYTGIGWGVAVATTAARTLQPTWWALVPGGVLGGLGYCLLFTPMRWVDYVLYAAVGTGLPLLAWGLSSRLIGLVIPGSLLVGAGAGIYLAWQSPASGNPLVHTGIMLVWFAMGWALITLSGRIILHKFLWWPLIPGGILAMVGWGLYIGGDPDSALGFISNTGSIGLIIFGLYLLLMRKGIHH